MKSIGIKVSEDEYGNINFFTAFKRGFLGIVNAIVLKYCMYSVILSPFNYRFIRPKLWRLMGIKVGKNVAIGYEVWVDFNHTKLIEIGDNVQLTNRCLLLCHQRKLTDYRKGDNPTKLSYRKGKIIIEDNVMIGMGTTIMPGVTIGRGSIIGAGSVVTKSIPEYVIAAGVPAKIIKEIPE
jgi:acetyltransferase-like isoleucine patch superfamily enzyme